MTFRIDRSTRENIIVFTLSGEIAADDAAELEALLERDSDRRVVLDLRDVTLAHRDAVSVLARREADGARLANCPPYIREWISRERDGA
jgi:anti-anti-sigma regulatory factor